MPVTFLPEEEIYPPEDATLNEVALAFVNAVAQTRVVTNETIHRWAGAFEAALPKPSEAAELEQPDQPAPPQSRWNQP
jgi:hypothetical protein